MNYEVRIKDKNYSRKTIIPNSLFLIPSKAVGFTLIELLVVIAVIGILAVGGFVSFISYTQKVTLDNATSDVVNMLNTAKSRAQAQIKPNTTLCGGTNKFTFRGYKVFIDITRNTYSLFAACDNTDRPNHCNYTYDPIGNANTLPSNISIKSNSSTCFMFDSSTGALYDANRTITLNGSGSLSKTITVDAAGNISTN